MASALLALAVFASAVSAKSVEDMALPEQATPHSMPGVENLYQVSPALWRSAMPEPEGFAALDQSPIKTIVSLKYKPDPTDVTPDTGPKRINIPLRTWKVNEDDVLAFLKIATDPSQQPVLVHCRHGSDRTGTMVAAYRIVVQGWSKEQALAEMTSDQFGYHKMWRNLPKLIQRMDVQVMRAALRLSEPTQAP